MGSIKALLNSMNRTHLQASFALIFNVDFRYNCRPGCSSRFQCHVRLLRWFVFSYLTFNP